MNKKALLSICLVLALAFSATACKSAEEIAQSSNGSPTVISPDVNITNAEAEEPDLLKVSGSGKAVLVPDIATVYIGVENENKDPAVAQEENAALLQAVIDALKAKGVEDKDIVTQDVYLSEIYDYDKSPAQIVGYRMRTTMFVTISPAENAGAVIGAAVEAGANDVSGLNFTVSDSSTGYAQALQAAIKDAQVKAEAMAEALGVGIRVVPNSITETSRSYTPIEYSDDLRAPMANDEPMEEAEADNSMATPVSVGELTVEASVSINYEMYQLD